MKIWIVAILLAQFAQFAALAAPDSSAYRQSYRYPTTLEAGVVWARMQDLGKGLPFASVINLNATTVISSNWDICLALQGGVIPNRSAKPSVPVKEFTYRIHERNYATIAFLAGFYSPFSLKASRIFGLRGGLIFRNRMDNFDIYSPTGMVLEGAANGNRRNELGARFEAYGDLVRYKRVFLRGRLAYSLFGIGNPKKRPNQTEASISLGVSLGRKW